MLITISGDKKELELPEGTTIEKMLEKLDINRVTVLVRVNGGIRAEDYALEDGDEVEIIKVVSGG